MDTDGTTDTALLGRAVLTRRRDLGLSTMEMAQLGVPRKTLHNIETGARSRHLAKTLQQLDRALKWNEDTAKRLAAGDRSALVDNDEPTPAAIHARLLTLEHEVARMSVMVQHAIAEMHAEMRSLLTQ